MPGYEHDIDNNQSLLEASFYELDLLGRIAQFIYDASPHPNRTIALLGALAWMATITGRAFTTWTGAGLNLYLLLLATTGKGKEAATSGRAKLTAAIAKTVPTVIEFNGPNFVSAAGTMKAMEKRPSMCVNMAEAGYKFRAMTGSRVSPNDEQMKGFICDAYGKSGAGGVLDPNGNVDPEKSIKQSISRPALNIFAESIPSIIWESFDERLVNSGLLSRFIIVEANQPRAPLCENPLSAPDWQLTQDGADLASICLGHNSANATVTVYPTEDAKILFRNFSDHITGEINSGYSNVIGELNNRAWLNAQKIACIIAVGFNQHQPIVTKQMAAWATNMVVDAVNLVIRKFEKNEVGSQDGNETTQLNELRRVIREYIVASPGKYESSGCTYEMHRDHIFSQGYLSRRLIKLPTFANDRAGGTNALKRCIRDLCENDEIRRVTTSQMLERYQTAAMSFGLTHENLFMKGAE